jgi:protein-L-isoaspartate(D-aspartate) O-methyltransferase
MRRTSAPLRDRLPPRSSQRSRAYLASDFWIATAAPTTGESIVHIGCGTGYFTAILAELVGPTGSVVAFEVVSELAAHAARCLAPWPQVRVEAGDASELRDSYAVLYVNAGATHARPEWLAGLVEGGRLLLPLTVHLPNFPHGVGLMLLAERRAARWPARVVSPIGIYDCAGARHEDAEQQLRRLLMPCAAATIDALATEPHPRGDACLVHWQGFCLQRATASP